ncbi:MAG: ABC transporter substrate-binding protein [Clostridiales Family XIII bacterium]|jgi:ABC-type nitrate/sulfonate/bicarbonate transport system substrate-binding protein|nr:ABC transporter substrate-binding protein [Clostridiales Family XIII bacterium]
MKKVLVAALIFALVLTSGLSACGKDSNGSAAVGEDGNIVLKAASVYSNPVFMNSIAIGIEKGFFEEEGITIEPIANVEQPQMISALLSGNVDMISVMVSEGIVAIDGGATIKGVAGEIETRDGIPHMIYLVANDSPITRGADLVGKKVGVVDYGGCLVGYPLEYVRQDGVEDAKGKVEFVISPEETLVESVRAGDIDVAGLHLPIDAAGNLYPDMRILFDDYDILGETGGDRSWYFTNEFIEKNPEAVKRFIKAIAKTNNFIDTNWDEARKIYEDVADAFNGDIFAKTYYAPDALITEDHTTIWLELLSSGNSYQPLKNEWTFDQVATNEFNEKAK